MAALQQAWGAVGIGVVALWHKWILVVLGEWRTPNLGTDSSFQAVSVNSFSCVCVFGVLHLTQRSFAHFRSWGTAGRPLSTMRAARLVNLCVEEGWLFSFVVWVKDSNSSHRIKEFCFRDIIVFPAPLLTKVCAVGSKGLPSDTPELLDCSPELLITIRIPPW